MSDLRTAALRALNALSCLEYSFGGITEGPSDDTTEAAITDLKAALAEPVQEVVALKWLPAPRKTEWGSGMVSADVEIDRDHTLTLYCEEDQTAKVDAMFRRVFCKEEA